MIIYENEIKKMNVWEKVVQTSNQVGFAATSVEKAKVKLSKAMSSFGLVLYQASEGTYRLINIHDTNECVEIAGQTRDNVLLDLFNISIVEEEIKTNAFEPKQEQEQEQEQANSFVPKFSQTVNTPQEAVTKANEVKANTSNKIELSDVFTEKFNEQLRRANEGQRADNQKMIDVMGKSRALGFERADFKNEMFMVLNVDSETQIAQRQAEMIYETLTWHLTNLGIPTKK